MKIGKDNVKNPTTKLMNMMKDGNIDLKMKANVVRQLQRDFTQDFEAMAAQLDKVTMEFIEQCKNEINQSNDDKSKPDGEKKEK